MTNAEAKRLIAESDKRLLEIYHWRLNPHEHETFDHRYGNDWVDSSRQYGD
jgi:hypothetical protein